MNREGGLTQRFEARSANTDTRQVNGRARPTRAWRVRRLMSAVIQRTSREYVVSSPAEVPGQRGLAALGSGGAGQDENKSG